MKIQKKNLTPIDSETFKTKIKFKRRNIALTLTNETASFDDTFALANTILEELKTYEDKARKVLLDDHVTLEKGQKLVLNSIEVGEEKYVSFIYNFMDGAPFPVHTFFVQSFDKGQSFEA
ncbi:MAG: hypothetical protein ACRBFS_17815 [Aureispira sp.]